MPAKPFDFMIVSLNKDYTSSLKRDDICIVTPHNWYGNTNGWNKNDPESHILEQREKDYYKANPYNYQDDRVYWMQERGYILHSKRDDIGTVVSRSDNHWTVLNVDGKDNNESVIPSIAYEVLEKYKR